MELTIVKDGRNAGNLIINDAEIIWPNFAGRPDDFNRDGGKRNFNLLIKDQEIADVLIEEGWAVRIKPPTKEGELPRMTLKVNVVFNNWGPLVYLRSGRAMNTLNEDTIAELDTANLERIDMEIRPYDWGPINGKYGRTAYLVDMCATQRIDRYMAMYAEEEAPEEVPWD